MIGSVPESSPHMKRPYEYYFEVAAGRNGQTGFSAFVYANDKLPDIKLGSGSEKLPPDLREFSIEVMRASGLRELSCWFFF